MYFVLIILLLFIFPVASAIIAAVDVRRRG